MASVRRLVQQVFPLLSLSFISFILLPVMASIVIWYWWVLVFGITMLPLATGVGIIGLNIVVALAVFPTNQKGAFILLVANYIVIILELSILRSFFN